MKPPIIVAMVHEKIIHLKSAILLDNPNLICFSTVFASSGAWKPLAVLEIRTRILNKAKEIAMRPVLIPTILTE